MENRSRGRAFVASVPTQEAQGSLLLQSLMRSQQAHGPDTGVSALGGPVEVIWSGESICSQELTPSILGSCNVWLPKHLGQSLLFQAQLCNLLTSLWRNKNVLPLSPLAFSSLLLPQMFGALFPLGSSFGLNIPSYFCSFLKGIVSRPTLPY